MRKEETKDYIVEFDDCDKTKNLLFHTVVDFFIKHEAFSGESICQSDAPLLDAPNLLSEIADEVLRFKTTWKEL